MVFYTLIRTFAPNMNRLTAILKLLIVVFTISFTVACQQGTGGKTAANKSIDWHDSAYNLIAETQELFNNDQHDSLLAVAPKVLDFLREHHEWEYYYMLWQNVAEDHAWYNEMAEATSEAEAMQKDAIERKDTFGLASSYVTQAIAYQIQDNYIEAQKGFRKAISLYPEEAKRGQLVSIYSYYAESLEATKDYAKLDSLLGTWRSLLDNLSPATCREDSEAYAHWYYLYFTRKIAFQIKSNHLTEAATDIDSLVYYAKATGISDNHRFFIANARHDLAMAQGNYTEALNYAEEMIKLSPGSIGSKSCALECRAEALEKLGRYREALADVQAYTTLNDSITQANNREQLNRLNKRYQVNELQSQNDMLVSRSRFTTGGVAMILGIVALLAFLAVNSRWTRRIEIKNQQLQRERNVVVSQNKQLALERDRAEAASKAKTAFIRSMTHEIRTPLNAISGFSQILTMDDASITAEMRDDMCQRIMDSTRMLTNILDDLILISDYESRTEKSRTEDCLIASITDQAIDAVRPLVADGVTIESQSSLAPEQMVKTTPIVLQNILAKLLENAAKFTTQGHITLTTDVANGQLHMAVIDTGPGIPADKHIYVFKRFTKLDSFSQGAGLGLSVARLLAEHMGGTVTIDANYQDGAKFDVIIPIA